MRGLDPANATRRQAGTFCAWMAWCGGSCGIRGSRKQCPFSQCMIEDEEVFVFFLKCIMSFCVGSSDVGAI